MASNIRKETFKRLHGFTQRGEKHDNLINRLLDTLEQEKMRINISNKTIERLVKVTGCKDVDEALNMIMDKVKKI